MDRIFTFGCSFTSYAWPTWADILIKDFNEDNKEGYNFGQSGAGNLFIFIKLMEAIRKYNITKNDLVMICWTSLQREDRYLDGQWVTPGNIYSQNIYNDEFIGKWCNFEHFVYRDCALMQAVKLTLENIGCKYVSFSMSQLKQMDSAKIESLFKESNDIIDFYGDSIKLDLKPMMEHLGLTDRTPEAFKRRTLKTHWNNTNQIDVEWHPTPTEHIKYVYDIILPSIGIILKESTIDYVNTWSEIIDSFGNPINLQEIEKIKKEIETNKSLGRFTNFKSNKKKEIKPLI